MIKFLLKGLLRDKSRSVLPVVVVSLGVFLTVFFTGYIKGAINGMIEQNARFDTGHVKVVTKAYAENITQRPLDLALLDTDILMDELKRDYPKVDWKQRIQFGGILDVSDENGDTKSQGIASGMSFDLTEGSSELERLNITTSVTEGRLPQAPYEMLMGKGLLDRLQMKVGDEVTYFGSTMDGGMSFQNFVVVGVIEFGTSSLDNMTFMVDLKDAQRILDMENGCGEIVGFLENDIYDQETTVKLRSQFNAKNFDEDIFSPTMLALRDQKGMASIVDIADSYGAILSVMFIIAMSIVLWNTGLLGGLRRYQEFGIRIALGESKKAIYKSLLWEALLVGVIGSFFGTIIGLGLTAYMQYVGFDVSSYMNAQTGTNSMMMTDVIRAQFSYTQLYIGYVPGVIATLFGALLSGRGIFQRQTSELFNELGV